VPKILVVAPNWIGDTLLAQPLFARLQHKLPGLTLDVLAPAFTAPVLNRMPEVTSVMQAPFEHGKLHLKLRWRIGKDLRAQRYDSAIVLPNSFKAALVPFFADIPLRVGFVGESRYGILNVVHRLDKTLLPLMADRYAQLAEVPGQAPERPLATPRLEVDNANQLITLSRLGLERSRPVVAFCPGAEFGPAKRWPVRHFAALAKNLIAHGRSVWIFGSEKERVLGEEILAGTDGNAHCINLAGRTDLAGAIDLMALAESVVSNDSGLMHVAAALGRPLVALYGSSSPVHTPPLAAARIVRTGIDCSPCYQRECPLGHFKCMNELDPGLVMTEISVARETHPAPASD
jgi:heptosyltransferase-2